MENTKWLTFEEWKKHVEWTRSWVFAVKKDPVHDIMSAHYAVVRGEANRRAMNEVTIDEQLANYLRDNGTFSPQLPEDWPTFEEWDLEEHKYWKTGGAGLYNNMAYGSEEVILWKREMYDPKIHGRLEHYARSPEYKVKVKSYN